mmetsp:Transcript_104721/g.223861  ORF Transcript_104721/g.223861 Transcript_104721/m.223861 type:complete len:296 (-) Transcript_104721:75-962(-)
MAMQFLVTLLLVASGVDVWASSVCANDADSCVESEDGPSLAQLRKSEVKRHQHAKTSGSHVKCTYSTTMCAGNQCCPRSNETDDKTYPCPTADADFDGCETTTPRPYLALESGTCATDSSVCDAAGWVYCQDANCGSTPVVKNGVLVAECLCWQPPNVNLSSLPKEGSGASCVMNAQNPSLNLPEGSAMCEAMKNGDLVSTYGPEGWKPPLVIATCPARTTWAWCWGAPCERVDKQGESVIVCDCPVMISDYDDSQLLSVSSHQCESEDNPCSYMHNGSPPGPHDIQQDLTQCEK